MPRVGGPVTRQRERMTAPKPLSRAKLQEAIIDRIVADLSPTMREALLWLPADGTRRVDDRSLAKLGLWSLSDRKVAMDCRATLVRSERSNLPPLKGRFWPSREWWLTELGKLVRARVAASMAVQEGSDAEA